MNTRLKIICVLFGIAYFYFVGATIIDEFPSFISGFNEGQRSVRNFDTRNNHDETDRTETVYFNLKPISGYYTFPSSMINLKTGNPVRAELSQFIAKVDKTQLPPKIKIGYTILFLLTFPLFFVIIFIPIQTYRVIRSIVKNGIFNPQNVNRIRWIGYCLLYFFIVGIYAQFISVAEARALVDLEDYHIVFKVDGEYYWLLFALVTLLFAEIMKISHTIKEEQDLTI
jgi:hypothetical protein